MPAMKILNWGSRVELDEKLKKVDNKELTLKEVQEWCLSKGFDISISALSTYKNTISFSTIDRIQAISEKIENRAQGHFSMTADLKSIISRLKVALDNTEDSNLIPENPREAATLALAIGNLAKTVAELESSESTETKSVVLKLVERKSAQDNLGS